MMVTAMNINSVLIDKPRFVVNRWRRVTGRLLLAAGIVFGLSACVHHGAAKIVSNPAGAEVVNLEDDTVLGVTPVTVWWRESDNDRKHVNVRLQKEGYRDKTASFWVTLRHKSRNSALENPQFVETYLEKESE